MSYNRLGELAAGFSNVAVAMGIITPNEARAIGEAGPEAILPRAACQATRALCACEYCSTPHAATACPNCGGPAKERP